ncbi:MAG: 3-deoxy-manno-octulosonate cytidylyltransferase [Bacteroidota bacterium]|nr:3-deoxy-manno-octulosonate cytidylyltransferase [Bacteroidota bacterium]
MNVIGIIPARYASTRFPGKPLTLIHGKTMIRRVYERASLASRLSKVVVATDDKRIFDHVLQFGGEVVMTSSSHESGTDRCAEALQLIGGNFELVINIQGDEPYIYPEQIDLLIKCFDNKEAMIGTLIKPISDPTELGNRNIPKVVKDFQGWALYFSRLALPYYKPENLASLLEKQIFFKHIGIYGYRAALLPQLAALPQGILESSESLEQLRWLENGYRIMTAVSDHENIAVDTPSDVVLIEKRFSVSD